MFLPLVSMLTMIHSSNCLFSHAIALVHALGGAQYDNAANRSKQPEPNATTKCDSSEWSCRVKYDDKIKLVCFPHNWVCDGHHDCEDGSDEHQCESWKDGCGSISKSCTGDDCRHEQRDVVCGAKLAAVNAVVKIEGVNTATTMVALAVVSCLVSIIVFVAVSLILYRKRQGKSLMSWERLDSPPQECVTMEKISHGQFVSLKSEIVRPKRSDIRASLTENMEEDTECINIE